jgi:hypothetical protein
MEKRPVREEQAEKLFLARLNHGPDDGGSKHIRNISQHL